MGVAPTGAFAYSGGVWKKMTTPDNTAGLWGEYGVSFDSSRGGAPHATEVRPVNYAQPVAIYLGKSA